MHPKPRAGVTKIAPERLLQDQIDASFYFSDEYRPNLDMDGPARYLRENASPYELKNCVAGIMCRSCFGSARADPASGQTGDRCPDSRSPP